MQLRRVTEKTLPSSDGDKRTRESQRPRLSAPARRRSLPWLMLGVLLVAGCSGSAHHTGVKASSGGVLGAGQRSGSWASDAELAWITKLGAWDARLLAGLRRAGEIESSPRLVRKLLQHDSATILAHQRRLGARRLASVSRAESLW